MTFFAIGYGSPDYGSQDSPFFMDTAVWAMRQRWEIMKAVTSGTEYLHENRDIYLPRMPREDKLRLPDGKIYDPHQGRVNLSVLAPFVKRLIHNAAGMVLRRKIMLEGGDSWWEDEFRNDVDGDGSSLDQFAMQRLEVALTYGMSSLIVDAPSRTEVDDGAPLRPHFVPIDPWQYLGSRRKSDAPGAELSVFRYQENIKFPKGTYGEEYITCARVIVPGGYEIIKQGEKTGEIGSYDLDYIPLVNIYAERQGFMCASPPLADVAHLNIAHYRMFADLMHSLHIAAIGLLVLEDYDDKNVTTGTTYAIKMTSGSKAYWVQCDAGSFVAQGEALGRLENEISHLGVTKLLGQKFVAESADAKRIDQQQANCVLSVAAMELEKSLNQAFRIASEYRGIEPPKVVIDRDFDFYRLLGQDVSVLSDLEDKGQLPVDVFIKILKKGEWLPDDIDPAQLARTVTGLKEKAKAEEAMRLMAAQREASGPAGQQKGPSAGA
jgi:hypothetical protein